MYIDKIKQVIELQGEIREENNDVININITNDNVLIRNRLFKEIFTNRKYSVEFRRETYFYEGEFEGLKFITNCETPIFDFNSESINS